MLTVFVTGIFDLLHLEHVRFLKNARNVGDKLIVGLESDVRAKRLKGPNRPIMSQQDRQEMLEALAVVDRVIILPEQFDTHQDYERMMQKLSPDIYAVSENSPFIENKKRICRKLGIEFKVVHRYNPEVSTSKMIEKI